jgi:hypothetical protein
VAVLVLRPLYSRGKVAQYPMGEPQGQSGHRVSVVQLTRRILLLTPLRRGGGDVIWNSAWTHIRRHTAEMAFLLFRDQSMFSPIMYCCIILNQLIDEILCGITEEL